MLNITIANVVLLMICTSLLVMGLVHRVINNVAKVNQCGQGAIPYSPDFVCFLLNKSKIPHYSAQAKQKRARRIAPGALFRHISKTQKGYKYFTGMKVFSGFLRARYFFGL